MGGGQGHPQAASGEHHHHPGHPRQLREELGVAGEGHAPVVDDTLVHRGGDEGGELTVQTTPRRPGEGGEDVGAVGGVEDARTGRRGKRHMQHFQGAGGRAGLGSIIRKIDLQAEGGGPFREQGAVRHGHQPHGQGMAGQGEEEVGADPGGLARGDGQHRPVHYSFSSSRYST